MKHYAWIETLVVLFAIATVAPGCSTQKKSQSLGTAEDYLAQGQDNAYANRYGPYDLYTGYEPYFFSPPWYIAPAYYYARGDGDNDCDDGNCRDRAGHKPPVGSRSGPNHLALATPSTTLEAATHRFDTSARAMSSAHFGRSIGRGTLGGAHGHR
jgi:hypothetical protein